MIAPVFFSLRPERWAKNLLVFAGIVLSGSALMVRADAWLYSVAGFMVFCLLSGVGYLLNDLVDLPKDRINPHKRHRPVASGQLSLAEAKASIILLLMAVFVSSWNLGQPFFYICLAYFMVNLAYCFSLKAVIILDLMTVATGMSLRMVAGFALLQRYDCVIKMQSELVLWAFILGLMTSVIARRHESMLVDAGKTRIKSISLYYAPRFLDQVLWFCAILFVVVYSWASLFGVLSRSGNNYFFFISVPVVIYATLRLLYLTFNAEPEAGSPRKTYYDRSLQLAILVFMVAMLIRPLIENL